MARPAEKMCYHDELGFIREFLLTLELEKKPETEELPEKATKDQRRVAILFLELYEDELQLIEPSLRDGKGRMWTPLELMDGMYANTKIGTLFAEFLASHEEFRERTGYVMGKALV